MSIKGLERLGTWCKAKEFALAVYRQALPALPAEEKWGLNGQIRRAAQSIPANIAEGYGRFYYQETIRFCYIDRGSLDETLSHLVLAYDLGYLAEPVFRELAQRGEDLSRLLNGYIAYLKHSRQGANEPGANLNLREIPEPYQITELNDDMNPPTTLESRLSNLEGDLP
jgi:four helix bundle protein